MEITLRFDPDDPDDLRQAREVLRVSIYAGALHSFGERFRKYRKHVDEPDIEHVWNMWVEETEELNPW